MKTAFVLLAAVAASSALHFAVLSAPRAAEPNTISLTPARVQEAVVHGSRLAKFKKPSLVTVAR